MTYGPLPSFSLDIVRKAIGRWFESEQTGSNRQKIRSPSRTDDERNVIPTPPDMI